MAVLLHTLARTARRERIVQAARPAAHVLLRLVDTLQPSVQLILGLRQVQVLVRRVRPRMDMLTVVLRHQTMRTRLRVRSPARRVSKLHLLVRHVRRQAAAGTPHPTPSQKAVLQARI